MKMHTTIFFTLLMLAFSSSVFARCSPVYKGKQGDDVNGGVPLIFGSIKLQPPEFMPDGLIGVTSVSVGQAQSFQSQQGPDTWLYTCDLADQGKTYEYFATNGDSNVGGNVSNGNGVYQTYFPFIGIKLIRDDGKVFSRYWQHSPITGHKEGNKLNFYARDFSNVTAEIYRLPATMRGGDPVAHWGCKGPADDNANGITYSCPQPNGYTVFVGPGWNDDRNITLPNADSNTNWSGFSNWNWIGFGMQYSSANMFQQTNWGCRVLKYTNPVVLPPVTASALKSGIKTGSDFSITYRCGGPSINTYIQRTAGVGPDKISVAFRTNNSPLPDASGNSQWMPYLVSDNYGQDGYASNVGIAVTVSGSDHPVGFIANAYNNDYTKGWFSPLAGEIGRMQNNPSQVDITSQYFASYAVLNPDILVKPGKVDATAYIVVRYW